jgi:hypothetical protein
MRAFAAFTAVTAGLPALPENLGTDPQSSGNPSGCSADLATTPRPAAGKNRTVIACVVVTFFVVFTGFAFAPFRSIHKDFKSVRELRVWFTPRCSRMNAR